ncbi:hypothetical protein [Streptomyces sp. WAC06614]|uniref:hypothetical protein n=1 Tax=Streptomyces sp. WAC06614 TaxID=2487416 RepID=UPI000F793CD5|nr:hypothetical protein [Streptomyces sp. WAC06614]RSS75520.1 hypothetical protein EF918_24165 [Streptomyces sp. WAC06614]
MSFGDPNNPYGQQAPQGQPGYGYPQQTPYGYPQQTPYPAGPGGYPGAAAVPMPGGVRAARVILFVLGGLTALGGVLLLIGGAAFASIFADSSSSSASDVGTAAGGVFAVAGIIVILYALWPLITAGRLAKGRGGVRVSGIIYGSLQTLFGGLSVLSNLAALGASSSSSSHTPAGVFVLSLVIALISTGLGLWILIGLAKGDAGAYFRRPQY